MNKRMTHKLKNLYNTLTSIYSNEQIVRNCLKEEAIAMEQYEKCVERYRLGKISLGLQDKVWGISLLTMISLDFCIGIKLSMDS